MAGIWINSQFPISDAVSLSQPVWELLVANWGDFQAPNTGYSVAFPRRGERGLPSVHGIAIGPQSTVDRCWVAYDLQKQIPADTNWDYLRRVSLGAPAMFPQLGAKTVVPLTTDLIGGGASLVVTPSASVEDIDRDDYTAYYTTDYFANVLGFSGQRFLQPTLHLLFYLKPPALYPPTARFPYTEGRANFVSTAQQQAIAFPAFGRKRVSIFIQNSDTPANVIVRGWSGVGSNIVATLNTTAIAANAAARIYLDDPQSNYILVYIDPGAVAKSIPVVMRAED